MVAEGFIKHKIDWVKIADTISKQENRRYWPDYCRNVWSGRAESKKLRLLISKLLEVEPTEAA